MVEDECMIGDRWGVSESETLRSYPCDAFVAAPTLQAWRGVQGRIVSANPGRQLTGTIMGAYMSYVLVPQEHDTTRLLLKVVMRTTRWAAPALSVGDLIMVRRQLLNLRQLAERYQRAPARLHLS
jgi:hypothetical protein